ncbi:unnamed protein product [Blepharisma stoltei]|uniref:Uncharacterized protein n=1 Tax=Blepharisma stoltei TaxID=1481888 RepID=A0AAU9J217_9CILI|nr:unnamed protein product [Blepharisma stoltei]CAG9319404.1 unnamed protein product [Blepharisma stoltei]
MTSFLILLIFIAEIWLPKENLKKIAISILFSVINKLGKIFIELEFQLIFSKIIPNIEVKSTSLMIRIFYTNKVMIKYYSIKFKNMKLSTKYSFCYSYKVFV